MNLPATIWDQISEGDKSAYEEAYVHLFRRFYNYGKKITDNETVIQDAAQEALLTLWKKRLAIPEIRYPQTYFYASFRYLLFDKLKENQKMTGLEDDFLLFEQAVEEDIVKKNAEDDSRRQLSYAMNSLSKRQREAIFLRFYEELPFEQVAAIMGITPKATYKIVARALLNLRNFLKLLFPCPALFGVVNHYF